MQFHWVLLLSPQRALPWPTLGQGLSDPPGSRGSSSSSIGYHPALLGIALANTAGTLGAPGRMGITQAQVEFYSRGITSVQIT